MLSTETAACWRTSDRGRCRSGARRDRGSRPHTDGRHPRSAFALTDHLVATGVRDAVMRDGGASSQLAIGGVLVNQPCCEARTRPMATVLVIAAR